MRIQIKASTKRRKCRRKTKRRKRIVSQYETVKNSKLPELNTTSSQLLDSINRLDLKWARDRGARH